MSTRKTARALKTTPGRKQAANRDLIDTGTDNGTCGGTRRVTSRSLTTSTGRSPQIVECAPTRRRRAARVTRATGRQFHVHSDGSERPLVISEPSVPFIPPRPLYRTVRIAPLRLIHCFALIPRWVKNASMAVNTLSYCARVKGKCPAPETVTSSSTTPALFSAW